MREVRPEGKAIYGEWRDAPQYEYGHTRDGRIYAIRPRVPGVGLSRWERFRIWLAKLIQPGWLARFIQPGPW